jgi:hypothetical protein
MFSEPSHMGRNHDYYAKYYQLCISIMPKFANVRKLLFKKLNIKLQDLCPSKCMKTVTRLLNPNNFDTEYMSLYP